MAPRPYWKGFLKLSLVSCPVALYSASSSTERVAFRQISKTTGNRLRQQLIDEGTKEPIGQDEKGRGYEVAKNTYLPIDDDELEAVAIESNHTIHIDRFVPRAQIDERYADSPYYVAPDDEVGQEAFAVIREAMKGKGMVALARVVLSKRERVIMLQPWDKGLLATTLRYPYELRPANVYFDEIADVKVDKEMLDLAEHLIDQKKADFDPSTFVDRYEEAVVAMIKDKQKGMPVPKDAPARPAANIINLMDALKKSLGGGGGGASKGAKGKKASKAENLRNAPQFKLPIRGGKADQAPAKGATKTHAETKASTRRRSA
jgi:DNA end-binding protein Ku